MARIKYVINERRLTFEGAVNILAEEKEAELAARREVKAEMEQAEEKAQLETEKPLSAQETAAEMATAGVFDTIPSEPAAEPVATEEAKPKSNDPYII